MTTVIALGSKVILKRDKTVTGRVEDIYNRGMLRNYITVRITSGKDVGQCVTIRESNWRKK